MNNLIKKFLKKRRKAIVISRLNKEIDRVYDYLAFHERNLRWDEPERLFDIECMERAIERINKI